MSLFPHVSTPLLALNPMPFRSGCDVHALFRGTSAGDLMHEDLFTAVYCTDNVSRVSMQFEIRQPDTTGALIGCSTLMELNPHAGHVRAGVFVTPDIEGGPEARHARLLTANFAFAMWNLRKVYSWQIHGEQPWPNSLAVREGTLRNFLHDGLRTLDMDVIALYRSTWDERGATMVDEISGGTGG
ncbi:MAG: hypothetical protein ACFCVF_05990 [Kineosporiaceae bacterium]